MVKINIFNWEKRWWALLTPKQVQIFYLNVIWIYNLCCLYLYSASTIIRWPFAWHKKRSLTVTLRYILYDHRSQYWLKQKKEDFCDRTQETTTIYLLWPKSITKRTLSLFTESCCFTIQRGATQRSLLTLITCLHNIDSEA